MPTEQRRSEGHKIIMAIWRTDATNPRVYTHGSHGVVFQKLSWANSTTLGVRLDGYDVERVTNGLSNSHPGARVVVVAVPNPWFLRVGIRTGVELAVEQPFTL